MKTINALVASVLVSGFAFSGAAFAGQTGGMLSTGHTNPANCPTDINGNVSVQVYQDRMGIMCNGHSIPHGNKIGDQSTLVQVGHVPSASWKQLGGGPVSMCRGTPEQCQATYVQKNP